MARAPKSEKVKARERLFKSPTARHGSFAMIQPHRATALVSTAALHTLADKSEKDKRHPDQAWQTIGYDRSDEIGPLGYLLNLKANIVAACELRPLQLVADDDGKEDWAASTDEAVKRVMAAFVGPQGGQAELKRRAALHLSTAGETHVLGTSAGHLGEILWEFLSTDELRVQQDGTAYRKRDGMTREDIPTDAYMARCWRSHPRYSDLSDSEVRRVLPICDKIVALDQMIQAVLDQRLAAGILYVPDEMSFADAADEEGEEEDEEGTEIDKFTKVLMTHLSAPKKDKKSAAGLVPLVIRGPAALADSIKLIEVARNLDTQFQELRRELMTLLLQALDAPPEITSGKSSLNHWTAANVDTDFLSKHIVPLGRLLADFITVAYLRPMLEIFENMTAEQAATFKLDFDTSAVTSRVDEGGAARSMYDSDLLNRKSTVRANGFDESDLPDADELFEKRVWKLVSAAPAVFAKALLPLIPGFENVDVEKLGQGGPMPGGADGVTGSEPNPLGVLGPDAGKPADAPVPSAGDAPGFGHLLGRITAASDMAVERAVEKAAARVISRVGKDPTIRDRLSQASKLRGFTLIQPVELERAGLTLEGLLAGEWDGLSSRTRAWVRDFLLGSGVAHYLADDAAVLAASTLCSDLQAYVVENLHSGLPVQADGSRIPQTLVVRALDQLLTPAG